MLRRGFANVSAASTSTVAQPDPRLDEETWAPAGSVDEGALVVMVPDTELDLLTCPGWRCELLGELERADCKVLIVDLSRVEFFGAAGLGVLVDVRDRADQCGAELRLVVSSRSVWRPLEVTGLAAEFAIYGSRADALTGDQVQMR